MANSIYQNFYAFRKAKAFVIGPARKPIHTSKVSLIDRDHELALGNIALDLNEKAEA